MLLPLDDAVYGAGPLLFRPGAFGTLEKRRVLYLSTIALRHKLIYYSAIGNIEVKDESTNSK